MTPALRSDHQTPCTFSKTMATLFASIFTIIIVLMTILFGTTKGVVEANHTSALNIGVITSRMDRVERDVEEMKKLLNESYRELKQSIENRDAQMTRKLETILEQTRNK